MLNCINNFLNINHLLNGFCDAHSKSPCVTHTHTLPSGFCSALITEHSVLTPALIWDVWMWGMIWWRGGVLWMWFGLIMDQSELEQHRNERLNKWGAQILQKAVYKTPERDWKSNEPSRSGLYDDIYYETIKMCRPVQIYTIICGRTLRYEGRLPQLATLIKISTFV